jgi:hypothetical protein
MCGILWPWLQASEPIAVWLEAIALIAIFFLDWKERKENRKERREQHEETAAQLQVAQSQAEATKESADATTEAALAAVKSAEISAALHRPFMGVSNVWLRAGWGTRVWDIAFGLKNYGTLPALSVGLTAEVFTDNNLRMQTTESPSVQIFPSAEFVSIVRFDMGDPDQVGVHNDSIKLRIEVRIPYQSQDGRHFRHFEHTATVSFARGQFHVDKSGTH